jgi:hypothetical protein
MPSLLDGLVSKVFDAFAPQPAADALAVSAAEPEQPMFDEKSAAAKVLEFMKLCEKNRRAFDRTWFRSILYYLGNQWLTWDVNSTRWKEKRVRKWVPKPVTNRYASSVAAVCAAIQSTKVEPAAWPATNDHNDIATANVADRVIEVIKHEIRHDHLRNDVAKWVTLNGDCFVWLFYDKKDTTLGFTVINPVACQQCGYEGAPQEFSQACPQCASPADPIEINNPQHPKAQRLPIGRLKARALSPLQTYFNMDILEPDDRKKFIVTFSYEIQTVKDMYPEKAAAIQPDTSGSGGNTSRYFMDALAYANEESTYLSGGGGGSKEKVTLIHYMELPSDESPEGLQLVMTLGGEVCEIGPLESFDTLPDGTRNYFLPIVQFCYEKVPGRAYSKTPIFDLFSKQDQLNRIESLMELASLKGVNVNWLLPAGASVSNLSGEPAQIIRWTPTGTGGAKPEVVTVAPFHAAMLELKKQYQEDFEELAGTFDALKGNTPKGVSAGYAIQLLTERSYGRFGPVFANWEQGWIDLYTMSLKLFRTYATEPRFLKIKGSAGAWEINEFSKADLTGAIDLRVEGGASRPRSKLAEQALVEALFNMGIINPADPEQRFQVANMFGMGELLGSSAEDERIAAGEWQALLDWEPPVDETTGLPIDVDPVTQFPKGGPEVNQVFDNHMTHVMVHRKPVRTDVWNQLPPWKQLYWQNHQLDHLMTLKLTQAPPEAPNKPKGDLHAGSKSDEMPDKAANVNKGSTIMGSGGENQHGG